jgi:hypothetical protein
MSALAIAVEKQRWDIAAYWLLLGITEAAAKLPPDALGDLLAVLEEAPRT